MAIYLKFGDLKGESLAEGHKGTDGWMEINSCQMGAGRGISTPVGGSSKREASAPSISEIVVTRLLDSVSTRLFSECVGGVGVDATIEFVTTNSDKLETYLTVKLTNTMISGYSFSSGGDRPSESISLNFTKIDITYQGYDDKGKVDTTKKGSAIYDLTAAKRG